MFGAGWTEMLIIGIVALVVIGPKDLPIVMRKLGRVVATVRRMGSEFQREINKTTGLDQIADLRHSLTEPLRQTSQEIANEFNRMTPAGVEPSGVMKPLDPQVESVYEQIAATAGLPAGATPAATTPTIAAAEPSPAPLEALAPAGAVKPRRAAPTRAAAKAMKEAPEPVKPTPSKRTAAASAVEKPAPARAASALRPASRTTSKPKSPPLAAAAAPIVAAKSGSKAPAKPRAKKA